MKNTELRIGNLIVRKPKYGEQQEIVVTSQILSEMEGIFGYEYYGIPLTEGMLIKFGMDKYKLISIHLDSHLHFISGNDGYYVQLIKDGEVQSEEQQVITLTWINSVHQLQNLYFSLTENELKI